MTPDPPKNKEISEEYLLSLIIKEKWNKVVEIYENHPKSHRIKLDGSKETALHMYITRYRSKPHNHSKRVKQMIDCIERCGSLALSIQDTDGWTPLHVAAAVGWVDICEYIASKDRNLISLRNLLGETPLYTAAANNKLQAFLCLQRSYSQDGEALKSLCTRKDGKTALNVAILEENFRFAYQILSYYPNLINSVTANGETPLHVLAKKPYVFKSRCQLGFFNSIIYHFVSVEKLKKERYNPPASENSYPERARESSSLFWNPVSMTIFRQRIFTLCFPAVFLRWCKKQNVGPIDEEYQNEEISNDDDDDTIPPNYTSSFLSKFSKVILSVLGGGYFMRIKNIKEQHRHACQIMSEIIEAQSRDSNDLDSEASSRVIRLYPSVLLSAAKNGITEIVEKILCKCPQTSTYENDDEKNALMLAVENRQVAVFNHLLKANLQEGAFYEVDNEGNDVLHLAAKLAENTHPWRTPCIPLQMSWEIKWYKYVEAHLPTGPPLYNNEGKSSRKVFTETHKDLLKEANEWLTRTSESCSLIAALIASVTFATIASVPGGFSDHTGHPILGNYTTFDIFSVASLLAFCLSVTALIFFLAIITSLYEEDEFNTNVPRKLLVALTSMSSSIIALLVAFCAGHTFVLTERLRAAAVPIYVAASLPVMYFAIAQLPLYLDILRAAFMRTPPPINRMSYD